MNQSIVILAEKLGTILSSHNLTVSTAESCTGGGIAVAITEVSGSSNWFEMGYVVYSNQMKSRHLEVSESVLISYGAVSEQVTAAMLSGVLKGSGADLGITVSGIAGPGGGSVAKPVGTVCFSWGDRFLQHNTTCLFSGDRSSIREQAVIFGLEKLIEFVENG